MARRRKKGLDGERYCGNTNTLEVHDLDNENTNCQIDEILEAGHAKPFNSLTAAHNLGYDDCAYCLGDA